MGLSIATTLDGALLKVRREYLTPSYLASEHIDTPDPHRFAFLGEELLLFWRLPACRGKLHLSLLYHNHERDEVVFNLTGRAGVTHFRLLNDIYQEKGGVVGFKADLCQDGKILETYCDPLWAEPIQCGV